MTAHSSRVTACAVGRHRKVVATPVTAQATGYAQYVGRVGALAVALGVGMAVATGFGVGVARADDTESTTSSSQNDGPESRDSGRDNTSPDAARESDPDAGTDSTELEAQPEDETEADDPKAEESEAEGSEDQEPEVDSTEPLDDGGPDVEETEPAQEEPAQPPVDVTPTVIPAESAPRPDPVVPAADSETGARHVERPAERTATPEVSVLSVAAQQVSTQSTTAFSVATFSAQQQTALATSSAPIAPSLLDIPGRLFEASAAFVSSLLVPFVAPTAPTAPSGPTVLWAVLAWVRREFQRSFFNRTPDAVADSVTTDEDTPVVIDPLANDRDADGETPAVTSYTQPSNGTVVRGADGLLIYTPKADFVGTDSFTYIISDAGDGAHLHGLYGLLTGGGHADSATVTIVVGAVDDAPVAVDDTNTTFEDTAVSGNLLANDTDNDTSATGLTASLATGPSNGSAVVNADGTYTYTPKPNFAGADSFTYTVTDGTSSDIGTVEITVVAVDDDPIAMDDIATVAEDSGPTVIDVLANDSDPDAGDIRTIAAVTQPANGTVVNNGTSLSYTPNPDYAGPTDTFTYTITDKTGNTATATVTVTISPLNNDDPTAPAGPVRTTDEDTPISGNLLDGAADVDGDDLDVINVGPAQHGTLTVDRETGAYTYTPRNLAAGQTRTDVIQYTITDNMGGSVVRTLTVTVTGVNDAPTATTLPPRTTDEDTPISGNLLDGASDIDGDDLDVTDVGPTQHGTFSVDPETGAYTYTPNDVPTGETRTETIAYTVTDGNGATVDRTLTIVVTGVNRAPTAPPGLIAATTDDTPISGSLLVGASDPDGDDLDVINVAAAQYGSLTVDPETGEYTYTPNNIPVNQTRTENISYTITDNNGGTVTGTLAILINGVNSPPTAPTLPTLTTDEDTIIRGNVLDGATDPDGDDFYVNDYGRGEAGVLILSPSGDFVYIPYNLSAGETRTDRINYTVTDVNGATIERTLTIVVTGLNDAPTAPDLPSRTTDEDTPISGNLLADATDVDGDDLDIINVSFPQHGALVVDRETGEYTYTPRNLPFGQTRTDTITYTVTDGKGGNVTRTLTITVTGLNDAPVIRPLPPQRITDVQTVRGNLLDGATDPDGDPLTVSVNGAQYGSLDFDPATGDFVYTPRNLRDGQIVFENVQYRVMDNRGGVTTGTLSIIVTGTNDAPTAPTLPPRVTNEDTPITGNLLERANDADGDDLDIVEVGAAQYGTLSVNRETGSYTYTPRNLRGGETVTEDISYGITDGAGNTIYRTLTVTVNGLNDAPAWNQLPPPAVQVTGIEDTDVRIPASALLTGVTDIDGDPLTVRITRQPGSGTLISDGEGGFIYRPRADYTGSDFIRYVVTDGNADTFERSINVFTTNVNDAPTGVVAAVNPPQTTDGSTLIILETNDVDLGDTVTVTPRAAGGTVEPVSIIGPIKVYRYTPFVQTRVDAYGQAGPTDTVTFTLSDGTAQTVVTQTVPISPLAAGVVATVDVGDGPVGAAAHDGKLYVTNRDSGTVSVIDLATNEVVNTIDVGDQPEGIAAANGKIYVANFADDTVSVIRAADGVVVKTIPVGEFPFGVAVRDNLVYVSTSSTVNPNVGSLVLIDATRDVVVDTNPNQQGTQGIPLGRFPTGVTVGADRIFVSNFFGNTVTVINPSTNTVVRTIAVGGGPEGSTIVGDYLYVATSGDDVLTVIDTRTNTVVNTIAVGDSPRRVAAVGTVLVVTNLEGGPVTLYDTATGQFVDANPNTPDIDALVVGSAPVAVSVVGNRAYVTDSASGRVTVIAFGEGSNLSPADVAPSVL